MTLHTRVMVTTPGIDAREAFDKMRELIGATSEYTYFVSPEPESDNQYRREMTPGFHMNLGQGLPALMWVEHADGDLVSDGGHDKWCDDDCSGKYDDPAGYVAIHYDTAYSYRAENNASCSDLHAWLTREITAWLDERGASWRWYDELGDGWRDDLSSYGALGDPEVGRIGSNIDRLTKDDKREFGLDVMRAAFGGAQ